MARHFSPNHTHLSHEHCARALIQGLMNLADHLNNEFDRKSQEMELTEYLLHDLEQDFKAVQCIEAILDYIDGEEFIRSDREDAERSITIVRPQDRLKYLEEPEEVD